MSHQPAPQPGSGGNPAPGVMMKGGRRSGGSYFAHAKAFMKNPANKTRYPDVKQRMKAAGAAWRAMKGNLGAAPSRRHSTRRHRGRRGRRMRGGGGILSGIANAITGSGSGSGSGSSDTTETGNPEAGANTSSGTGGQPNPQQGGSRRRRRGCRTSRKTRGRR